jgi:methionyl-tRNA synthetase
MVAKAFGEIPEPGPLEPVDEAVRSAVLAAFDSVGELIARQRIRAATAEAMRAVGEVNKYVADTEPFKLKGEDQRERLATVLHTLIQCVSDLNTILAPFLPHAANRVHAFLGGEGELMPMPVVEDVHGLDGDADRTYPVITGDYSSTPRWASRPVTVGAPIAKPTGVFVKLDESVVEEELERLRQP